MRKISGIEKSSSVLSKYSEEYFTNFDEKSVFIIDRFYSYNYHQSRRKYNFPNPFFFIFFFFLPSKVRKVFRKRFPDHDRTKIRRMTNRRHKKYERLAVKAVEGRTTLLELWRYPWKYVETSMSPGSRDTFTKLENYVVRFFPPWFYSLATLKSLEHRPFFLFSFFLSRNVRRPPWKNRHGNTRSRVSSFFHSNEAGSNLLIFNLPPSFPRKRGRLPCLFYKESSPQNFIPWNYSPIPVEYSWNRSNRRLFFLFVLQRICGSIYSDSVEPLLISGILKAEDSSSLRLFYEESFWEFIS